MGYFVIFSNQLMLHCHLSAVFPDDQPGTPGIKGSRGQLGYKGSKGQKGKQSCTIHYSIL